LRRRAVLGTPKCEKSVGRRGSAPDPAGGAYSAPPDPLAGGEGLRGGFSAPSPRTPLTILSLCLSCVYVHTCMKMHCYFPLNVKHGASQLYLGGGLQLSSAGTVLNQLLHHDSYQVLCVTKLFNPSSTPGSMAVTLSECVY